jgi:hypothetical protein
MIPRRHLVTGGVLGGVLGALGGGGDAEAALGPANGAADPTEEAAVRIVQAIASLRNEVQGLRTFTDIAPVRDIQVNYLRGNGKFPDYMEIGTSIWFGVHDWHIRWQQPMALGRDNLGRYTIVLNQTVLIMRADASPTFIGVPYDAR